MRCGTFNVRSLLNKTVGVLEHLWEADCDICFMQETFLRDGDKAKLTEIKDSGWSILSDPRKHRSGGGIAMVYRSSIELKPNTKVTKFKSFQVMKSLLSAESELLRLVNIYRPPYTKKARYTECDFLKEFEEYLKILCAKPGNPLLTGDFNFHVERPNEHYPKKFLDLLDLYNLRQHVPIVPTHDQGGTLDLVITTQSLESKISNFGIVQSRTSSDHFLVLFDVDTRLSKNDNGKFLSYRNFKSIDISIFKDDLRNSNLSTFDPILTAEEATSLYNSVLTQLMDKHCPVIKKKLRKKPMPWLDVDLRLLRKKRRAAERAWRKGKGTRKDYIDLRDRFVSLEFVKRCSYNKESLRASAGDSKTLYKKLNRLLGNETQDLPKHQDPGKLSEDFKDFFAEKVNKIRKDIELDASKNVPEETLALSSDPDYVSLLHTFSPISAEDLRKLIKMMSNKFCCLDPIPSFLLKSCVDELTPVLLHILNTSIKTGSFPSQMKKAVVKPTLKKENADVDSLSNYRPVSNLSAISKLLERIVLNQLNDHLDTNNLHCPVQSGYRPQHSCETLLVRMTDDINKDIQAGNIVAVVLLDLSAAFDTIDHEILLEKLFKHYGVTGKALLWLRSYLESRYFCVKIGDTISSLLELLFGVPQGSLLGPILFILYIKDLQNIAAKFGLDIQLYADDSQLYISFHPSFPSELADVKDRINRCLSEIKHWMVGNFMKLNESKTELLVLGKSKVLKDCKMEVTVQFGNSTVTPTECKGDSWKSLGVKFDKSLTMERQINSVKQKCSWTMMNLRTIGRYLDVEVKLMMVTQLVISKLDYCNSLYMNLPKTRLNKLRSTLNGAIRFIYNIKDRSEDLLPYYKRAHILPLDQRIFFKVCLLTYKAVYGISPAYIRNLVEIENPLTTARTRSKIEGDCYRLKTPKTTNSKIDQRRFTNYAPTAWNSLPWDKRSLRNADSFKGNLKHCHYLL